MSNLINIRTFSLFWLQIMQEHAIFIYARLPHDHRELLEEAKRFETLYEFELNKWRKMLKPSFEEIQIANSIAIGLTKQFLSFKLYLLQLQKACQLEGSLYPLELDHNAREAKEYISILNNLNQSLLETSTSITLSKELFWLDIMGEHASLAAHFLDPAEQNMIHIAQGFANNYHNLFSACNKLAEADPINNSLTTQIFAETTRFNDWNIHLTKLRKECRLQAIVPPLFFDHMKREANYFITILKSKTIIS